MRVAGILHSLLTRGRFIFERLGIFISLLSGIPWLPAMKPERATMNPNVKIDIEGAGPAKVGTDIAAILEERGRRYGPFTTHAATSQALKERMITINWPSLAPDQREALEMIQHKIARILNGDPDYEDSWRDIAGYATLVADRLKGISR